VFLHLPLRPLCGLLLLLGCEQQKAPPLASLSPAPLEPLSAAGVDGGTDVHRLAPAPPWGAPPPTAGVRVVLRDEEIRVGPARFLPGADGGMRPVLEAAGRGPVLLVAEGDTYLAQVAPLLAALDDAHVPVWLVHEAGVAFPLHLRDERAFDAWLDEPKPGKIRVVQRQDGLELVSGVGKLPGPDPNGPTVPVRGGRLDIATARQGLSRLQQRFHAEDACLVPSFGTELRAVATALTAFWVGPKEPLFTEVCLVYPRPR